MQMYVRTSKALGVGVAACMHRYGNLARGGGNKGAPARQLGKRSQPRSAQRASACLCLSCNDY